MTDLDIYRNMLYNGNMAFRGDTAALILGALQGGPLHGYQIVRVLRESGAAGKMKEGQIYPFLHKLEDEALVTAEWEIDTGAAPRRVYQLTPRGKRELDRQRALWKKFVSGVGTVLVAQTRKARRGNA